jgi:competence protein ComEA
MIQTILSQISNRALVALLLLAVLAVAVPAAAAPQGVVNVNTADAGQLALLPRIGPSTATRIVEFREENGPFKAKEDLMLVRGIGERTYALLEAFVATEGETTLSEKVRPSELESGDGGR